MVVKGVCHGQWRADRVGRGPGLLGQSPHPRPKVHLISNISTGNNFQQSMIIGTNTSISGKVSSNQKSGEIEWFWP